MKKELEKLIEDQDQLKAMKKSCDEYESSLLKKIDEFMCAHFPLKKGESFTILDVVKMASEKHD